MHQGTKSKARISITIIPVVNVMLEKLSRRTGQSKSALVEDALKAFLERQLENDVRTLAGMEFADLPSEDEWGKIQSENSQ